VLELEGDAAALRRLSPRALEGLAATLRASAVAAQEAAAERFAQVRRPLGIPRRFRNPLEAPNTPPPQAAREAEKQLEAERDRRVCPVCLDREAAVAFLCGHTTCADCSRAIADCPQCRKPITQRIQIFM
jgi:hypothetical protein